MYPSLFAPHNAMLIMFVCTTCWLSMHLYTLAYMFPHKSCLLVCRPYFNTMKLWTSDPNLHLSIVDTTCLPFCLFAFFLVCSFTCLLSCFLACLFILWLAMSHAISILLVCFVTFTHYLRISFFSLLVCWFLVFAFACTQMERGRIKLG